MTPKPFYPVGNALTETMPLLASDGVRWLAYIEGVPSNPPRRRWHQVALPGRRLRFDSAHESRVTAHVPAGSPFLTEVRLQSLLDGAGRLLLPASAPGSRWRTASLRQRVIRSVTLAADVIRALLAGWTRPRPAGPVA